MSKKLASPASDQPVVMRSITAASLRELGFVDGIHYGTRKKTLSWRGAPVWWDGEYIRYGSEIVPVATVEELTTFLRALNLPKGRGRKAI